MTNYTKNDVCMCARVYVLFTVYALFDVRFNYERRVNVHNILNIQYILIVQWYMYEHECDIYVYYGIKLSKKFKIYI